MSPSPPRRSLTPGHHLFPERDGRWCLLRPDGVFVRLRSEPEPVERLARWLAGADIDPDEPRLAALIDSFDAAGFLSPPAQTADVEATDVEATGAEIAPRVAVLGDNPIADAVTAILGEACRVERGPLDATPPSDVVAVVACADWLADSCFTRLDTWSLEHGAALQTVYAEGTRCFVGPLAFADDAMWPRYADARARRLAAADHPEPLADHWRDLESGRALPPVPWPDAAGVAAVASAAAADVLAHVEGRPLVAPGVQLAFDPADFSWRRHPVLPVPRGVLAEAVA